MTEDDQKKLRSIIRNGVAEGVVIAGLLLLLLNFACGRLVGSGVRL